MHGQTVVYVTAVVYLSAAVVGVLVMVLAEAAIVGTEVNITAVKWMTILFYASTYQGPPTTSTATYAIKKNHIPTFA
jgi:hypothetical protein